jgi:hypothetical protein
MRRQLERCLGDALSRRGNHSSGAETRRASASVTMSSSSVNETSTASATGLLAKVLIPLQDKRFTMPLNQIVKVAEFGATKAAGFCERDWHEPKLSVTLGLLDVNVMRLCTLTTEEEKAIPLDA